MFFKNGKKELKNPKHIPASSKCVYRLVSGASKRNKSDQLLRRRTRVTDSGEFDLEELGRIMTRWSTANTRRKELFKYKSSSSIFFKRQRRKGLTIKIYVA